MCNKSVRFHLSTRIAFQGSKTSTGTRIPGKMRFNLEVPPFPKIEMHVFNLRGGCGNLDFYRVSGVCAELHRIPSRGTKRFFWILSRPRQNLRRARGIFIFLAYPCRQMKTDKYLYTPHRQAHLVVVQ